MTAHFDMKADVSQFRKDHAEAKADTAETAKKYQAFIRKNFPAGTMPTTFQKPMRKRKGSQ